MSNLNPLRFVTFLAPNVLPVYQFIACTVGEKLDLPTELVVGDSHDMFDALQPDVAFICGLPYVLMIHQPRSIPIELLAAPVYRVSDLEVSPSISRMSLLSRMRLIRPSLICAGARGPITRWCRNPVMVLRGIAW